MVTSGQSDRPKEPESDSTIEPSSTESDSSKFTDTVTTVPTSEKSLPHKSNLPTEKVAQIVETLVPKSEKQQTRDEQLINSQKLVPITMRSSFLPYESVPRDVVQEQRREKQLEWRRELEKQRDEDELRKRKRKDEQSRENLPDHHLFQSVTDVSRNSPRPERPGDIPRLDLARELTGVSNADAKNAQMAKNVRRSVGEDFHRNMNALKDPEELDRIHRARVKQAETEKELRKQIEAQKKRKEKEGTEENEPWWARQDRRKAELAKQVVKPQPVKPPPVKPPPVPSVEELVIPPNSPVSNLTLPLKLENLSVTREEPAHTTRRVIMREIQTQTERSPPPKNTQKPPTAGRAKSRAAKVVEPKKSTENINRYKTNLEVRAQQRDENRKKRQAQMAEEQRKVEKHLLNVRAKSQKTSTTNLAVEKKVSAASVTVSDPNTSFQDNEDILLKLQQIQQVLLRKQHKLTKK